MTQSGMPQKLKAHRTRQELTIEAPAKLSGVSRAMISKIERGEIVPTASTLGELAEAFDILFRSWFGGARKPARC